MSGRVICLVVLAVCLGISSTGIQAEESAHAEAEVLDDMKTVIPDYVAIIEEFGNSNLGAALDLIEAKLPRPFSETQGPFERGVRDHWQEQFGKLAEIQARFESVDLVGYQPLSSASRTLVFIGHGQFGPIMFRIKTFRYRNEWKMEGIMFQASWKHIEENRNFIRFRKPLQYPLLTQPVAQAEKPSQAR